MNHYQYQTYTKWLASKLLGCKHWPLPCIPLLLQKGKWKPIFFVPENRPTRKKIHIWKWNYDQFYPFPIKIYKTDQIWLRIYSLVNDVRSSVLNVLKDPVGSLPMEIMRVLHISWYNIHRITNFRPLMCQVYKTSDQLAVNNGIHEWSGFSLFKTDSWEERKWCSIKFIHVKIN